MTLLLLALHVVDVLVFFKFAQSYVNYFYTLSIKPLVPVMPIECNAQTLGFYPFVTSDVRKHGIEAH